MLVHIPTNMDQVKKPLKPQLFLRTNHSNISPFFNLKLFSVLMASILSICLSLFLIISVSAASRHPTSHHHLQHQQPSSSATIATSSSTQSVLIQEACKVSRDPPSCQASISDSANLPSDPTVLDIIQSAISVSSDGIKKAESMVNDILTVSVGNLSRTNAAKTCLEVLNYADYRLSLTQSALPLGKTKDARAWMSAAMVYEYDCWSALKYVNVTSQVGKTMSFIYSLIQTSSNAGGMIINYDNYGDKTVSWAPVKTERDGFWEVANESSLNYNGGLPTGLKADVTVCNAECDYEKVQDAVNAAPDNGKGPFVIYIKTGSYEETIQVPLEKKNLVLLGDGIGKTIITGSHNVAQPGMSTINTATVGVIGDGFMASGLTIQNTAGPGAHQAVAFRSDSDLSIIENCEFLGNQDTLYAHSLRQFYKSCRIQGNVDFIFGNSAAFFHECIILVAPRQIKPEKGESNAVTAHGRIDPVQSTGFVFYNCVITGTEEYMGLYFKKPSVHKNYLGRPWKEYSRTVFINCTLEVIIKPAGWMPWKGDFALKTLYYGEYGNSGAGSSTSGRVAWSSLIPVQHIDSYSVQNFIQGNEWIPTS